MKDAFTRYLKTAGPTFTGRLVAPGDSDYETARQVWNGAVDRRPALVAYCRTAEDVALTVKFARAEEVPVTVRSGGHSHSGFGAADDALVIDLSPMREVSVDPEARTAWAQAGALLRDLDEGAHRFGLIAPAGVVSHTGIAGLTLGGGFGYLSRRYGLTIDNLLSVKAVTADGKIIHVDAESDPDLFWAMRGAGHNFAIVTEFTYRLHEVRPVIAGFLVYPRSVMPEVLELCQVLEREHPRDLCLALSPHIAEGSPARPVSAGGDDEVFYVRPVQLVDGGSEPEWLIRLRAHGPLLDSVREMSFLELQSMMNPLAPHGSRWWATTRLLADISLEFMDELQALCAAAPHPGCGVSLLTVGGAVTDVADDATAYPGRSAKYVLEIRAYWSPGENANPMVDWGRRVVSFVDGLGPVSAYPNIMCDDYTQAELEQVYGTDRWARLVRLKAVYDPTNFLSVNHNIVPA